VRTRFFDDAITGITAGPDSPGQVVLLAAGMDTRAYRLELPTTTTVFELDRPELLRLKDTLLASTPAPRCTRRPVGIDLAGGWAAALTAAGFDQMRSTIWLAEGLTPYLAVEAVHRLLDQITTLSATGSHLLIDTVGQSTLDSAPMRPWLDDLARRGMPWRYGTDQPEDLFHPRGWNADITLISTAGTRLGRWPYPDIPRGVPGVPYGYLILAQAMGQRVTPEITSDASIDSR
jgi:methyltransferase (TIGR00027 family)